MIEYDRAALLDQLKIDEGVRLKVYRDTLGLLSIGIGRNLDGRGITLVEAEFLCQGDINRCEADLDANVPWWRTMTDRRQQGLANLCMMGWGENGHGLSSFVNMLEALRIGDYAAAAIHLLSSKYAAQVGARAGRIAQLFRDG